MEKWKQKLGRDATYNNLIKVFEQAGSNYYAEIIKDLLMKNVQAKTGDSYRNITPPPPLRERQSLVFPSESEQFSESPSYVAAAGVKLLQEDYQLGNKDAVNIIFEEYNNNAIINLSACIILMALVLIKLSSYLNTLQLN